MNFLKEIQDQTAASNFAAKQALQDHIRYEIRIRASKGEHNLSFNANRYSLDGRMYYERDLEEVYQYLLKEGFTCEHSNGYYHISW